MASRFDRDLEAHLVEHIAGLLQDLDDHTCGYGASWAEVNSNIHRGLGCLGVITDGNSRDLDDVARGFQLLAGRIGPSHTYVHIADYGGADVADQVEEAADLIARRERVIIDAAKQDDFSIDKLKAAWGEAAEIHCVAGRQRDREASHPPHAGSALSKKRRPAKILSIAGA